jgi:hypothetical protein
MPHFQLVTTDGEALGVVELGPSEWPVGSVISEALGIPKLRVVDNINVAGDSEKFDILVVEDVPMSPKL